MRSVLCPEVRRIEVLQSLELCAMRVEVLRREPRFISRLQYWPLAVDDREPGGVTIAPLDDHVLAEDA